MIEKALSSIDANNRVYKTV